MPAPAVQAYCFIPRIKLGRNVEFMVDTGASATCLNGNYALGLQRHMCKDTLSPSTGIGGQCGYYAEDAVLVFTDIKGQELSFPLKLSIQRIRRCLWRQPKLYVLQTPCLLGRDLFSKWELRYNHRKKDITLIAP